MNLEIIIPDSDRASWNCSSSIEYIRKTRGNCSVTDYAILLGISHTDHHISEDKSLKGRIGPWWVLIAGSAYSASYSKRSLSFYGEEFEPGIGIRPFIKYDNLSEIVSNVSVGPSGFLEIEFGEYPQYAASPRIQKLLDNAYENNNSAKSHFNNSLLKCTEKTFTTNNHQNIFILEDYYHEFNPLSNNVYEFMGKKYVRIKANRPDNKSFILSNGEEYRNNDYVWIEVTPIKWIVDEKNKYLISKNILAAGVRYNLDYKRYSSLSSLSYEQSDLYTFNEYFLNDIFKNTIYEMTPEEREKYLEEREEYESLLREKSNAALLKQFLKRIEEGRIIRIKTHQERSRLKKLKEVKKEQEERKKALKRIRENPNNFKYLEKYHNDREIVIEVLIMNGLLLEYVDEDLKNDEEIVKYAINSNPIAFTFAGNLLKDKEEFVLLVIRKNAELIEEASPRIQNDPDILKIFIKANENIFKYLNEKQRNNRELVIEAVKKDGSNLLHVSSNVYYDDKEVMLYTISQPQSTYLIMNASPRLQDDIEVMTTACMINKGYAKYASKRLRNMREFIFSFCTNYSECMRYADSDLQEELRIDFLKNAISNHLNQTQELSESRINSSNLEDATSKKI